MRILAISALALATVATPAFAQEEAKANFEGAYVGALFGWDHADDGTDSGDGIVGGAVVGYDFQASNIVLGVEAEANYASTKDCVGGSCVEAGRDLYAGGRVGMPVSPSTMVYAKAGYTNAVLKVTANGSTVASQKLDGVRGGVGIETTTDGGLFGRVEYRYSNYELGVSRHQGVVAIGIRF